MATADMDEPYDPSDDTGFSSDMECQQKDETIEELKRDVERLRKERNKYSGENYWLRYNSQELKINFDKKIKENESLKLELNTMKIVSEKKDRGVTDYLRTMQTKEDHLVNEIKTLKNTNKELSDKLNEKVKLSGIQHKVLKVKETKWTEGMVRTMEENRNLKTNNQKLLNEREELMNKIKQLENNCKKLETKAQNSKEKIKQVIERNNELQIKVEKHNKEFKGEYSALKAKVQKLRTETNSLKQQRSYFESHNETNKRKLLSSEVSNKKHRSLYANEVRKLSKLDLQNNSQLREDFIEFINERFSQSNNQIIENVAQTVVQIRDRSIDIQNSAERMTQKRPDNKVPCGLEGCNKTFANSSAAKHHITVAHNTDDDIEIIEVINNMIQ